MLRRVDPVPAQGQHGNRPERRSRGVIQDEVGRRSRRAEYARNPRAGNFQGERDREFQRAFVGRRSTVEVDRSGSRRADRDPERRHGRVRPVVVSQAIHGGDASLAQDDPLHFACHAATASYVPARLDQFQNAGPIKSPALNDTNSITQAIQSPTVTARLLPDPTPVDPR